MKKKKKDKEGIWNSTIGLLRRIPKNQTKWEFSWKDIVRPLAILVIFSISLIFWLEYWGLGIAILLTIIFEILGFKQHSGLLEVIGTNEFLPLHRTGFWEKLNSFFGYLITIFLLIDIVVILIWIGLI